MRIGESWNEYDAVACCANLQQIDGLIDAL
jgi:hypothetical protein